MSKRTSNILLRMSPDEKTSVVGAASYRKESVAAFIRKSIAAGVQAARDDYAKDVRERRENRLPRVPIAPARDRVTERQQAAPTRVPDDAYVRPTPFQNGTPPTTSPEIELLDQPASSSSAEPRDQRTESGTENRGSRDGALTSDVLELADTERATHVPRYSVGDDDLAIMPEPEMREIARAEDDIIDVDPDAEPMLP